MTARVMEHDEAIKSLAAERYLLGELTVSEREAYEEHLFSCPVCFDQLKAGTEFVGHLRRMGAEAPVAEVTRPRWRHFFTALSRPAPVIAFAVLFLCMAGLSSYQALLIHRMKTPQVVAVVTLVPESRGDRRVVTASRRGDFELRVVFQPKREVPLYWAKVLTASETEVASIAVPTPSSGEMQTRFNAGAFQSGQYVLVVYGTDPATGKSTSFGRYPFELHLQY
jgi:anti-sigma factor RsiW